MKILIAAGIEDTDRPDVLDVLRCRESVGTALSGFGHVVKNLDLTERLFSRPDLVLREIRSYGADLVFNLFEGWSTNSGTEPEFVRLLEREGIPFTGNGSYALSSCLDKMNAKTLLAGASVPVPDGVLVAREDDIETYDRSGPAFVKPCREDGNVGIDESSFIPAAAPIEEIRKKLREKLERFPRGVLIEDFIPGTEYCAGCLGTYPYEIVGISAMDYSNHPGFPPFYTYGAKWDEADPSYSALTPVQGAEIDRDTRSRITDIVAKAGAELRLSSYFRIDMRERDGIVYVLDVNPNPDINSDSGFARMAAARGMSYRDLVRRIVETSSEIRRERHG